MLNSDIAMPLPSLINDEYLGSVDEGSQPSDKPAMLSMFVASSRLMKIVDHCIHDIDQEVIGEGEPTYEFASSMFRAVHDLHLFPGILEQYFPSPWNDKFSDFDRNVAKLEREIVYSR